MTDNTEKTVLMKCERCGYEEEVPQKDLDLLRSVDKDPEHCEDHLLCPFCLSDMYRKDSYHFRNHNHR